MRYDSNDPLSSFFRILSRIPSGLYVRFNRLQKTERNGSADPCSHFWPHLAAFRHCFFNRAVECLFAEVCIETHSLQLASRGFTYPVLVCGLCLLFSESPLCPTRHLAQATATTPPDHEQPCRWINLDANKTFWWEKWRFFITFPDSTYIAEQGEDPPYTWRELPSYPRTWPQFPEAN